MKAPSQAGRLGAADRCPLCGAASGVTQNDDGYVCFVCGAPRILVDASTGRAGGERAHLELAKAMFVRRTMWGATAAVAAFVGAGALLAATALGALFHLGAAARAFVGSGALAPVVLAVFAFFLSRRSRAAARGAMERAELVVAEELVRSSGSVDGTALSRMMHISAEHAERLLAAEQVEELLTEPTKEGGPRLRVEDDISAESGGAARKRRTE